MRPGAKRVENFWPQVSMNEGMNECVLQYSILQKNEKSASKNMSVTVTDFAA